MHKTILYSSLILLISCKNLSNRSDTNNTEVNPVLVNDKKQSPNGPAEFINFTLPEPSASDISQFVHKRIWATFYHSLKIKSSPTELRSILDKDELSLLGNEKISHQDWCILAREGSGQVTTSDGTVYTVNFATRSRQNPINCQGVIGTEIALKKARGVRFQKVSSLFGLGVEQYQLVPYRTVAVDPKFIRYSSVLYIAEARGQSVTLADGKQVMHDGYFFAGDTGSAIIGNHIDIFTGVVDQVPFDFVTSSSSGAFQAALVTNPIIVQKLSDMHRQYE